MTIYLRRDKIGLKNKYIISYCYVSNKRITEQDMDDTERYMSKKIIPEGITTEFVRKYLGIKLKKGEQVKVDCKDLARIIKKAF